MRQSRYANRSDYVTAETVDTGHRSPDSWVLSLYDGEMPRYERVEIWGGASASARAMRQQATIALSDTPPSAMYARIDGCAVGSGCRVVRVSAFRDGERLPADMMLWPVPPPPPDDDEEGSDPKNLPSAYAGLLRQAYAHNEHFLGIVQTQTTALLMHLQSENKALREERIEMREALARAEAAASDREVRAYEMQSKALRDRALIGGAETLVRAAATHIARPAGAAAIGESPPAMAAIRTLAEGLTIEQLAKLSDVFTQEQMVLLTSVLESMERERGKAGD